MSADSDPFGSALRFTFPGLDKVVHGILYGVLGAALAWGRRRSRGAADASGLALFDGLLVTLGVLYGVTDEWHQSRVPGRDPSPGDVAADACGVLLGYAAFHLLSRRRSSGGAS